MTLVTPQQPAADPPEVPACLNCGTPAPGKFCPECGQETAGQPRTLAEFLHGRMARHLTRESQLWRTLWRLLLAPGVLTADYLRGRRARYVRPFKLYLVTSVIVFGAAQLFGWNLGLLFWGDRGIHVQRSTQLVLEQAGQPALRLTPAHIVLYYVDTPAVRRFAALSPQERFRFLHARRAPYASYLVLFLVPLLALAAGLFYRHRRYGEHLVFGLHAQTFLLIVLLAQAKLPVLLANALSWWTLAWFVLALRRVYGGTWGGTLGRAALLLALYLSLFFAANLGLILVLLSL